MKNGMRRAAMAAFIGGVGFFGCDNNASPNDGVEQTGLPSVVADADAEEVAVVSVCDWAQSGDLLVMGGIASLRLEDGPVVGSRLVDGKEDLTPRGTCDGVVEGVLAIDLNVDETVWDADDAQPAHLTVYVGRDRWAMFNPMPVEQKSDGSIVWEDTNYGDVGQGLKPGQRVGLLAHAIDGMDRKGDAVETTQWSVLGEPLFVVDAEDRVVFQKHTGETGQGAPIDVKDLRWTALVDTVKDCGAVSEGAKARRATMDRMWGPASGRASAYRAGMCFEKEGASAARACEAAHDCPAGQRCQNGACK